MNQQGLQPLFKNQSTKSLMKYRSESIEQRAMRIGKELLVPNIPKRKQSKNGFTFTSNTSNISHRSTQHKSQESLLRKMRMLEYELKRRLMDDTIFKNIFKTKQSHEMSHIDLYIEFRALEDNHNQLEKSSAQNQRLVQEYQRQLSQQQQQHLKNIQQFSQKINEKEEEWFEQKMGLKQKIEQCINQYQNIQFLMEEYKKKNIDLVNSNRKLIEDAAIEKESQSLKFIKFKSQSQQEIVTLKTNLQQKQGELQQLNQNYNLAQRQLNDYKDQIQHLSHQNQKLELKVKQLGELIKDITHTQAVLRKEQKDKLSYKYEQMKVQCASEMEKLIKQHKNIMEKQKNQYQNKKALLLKENEAAIKEERLDCHRQIENLVGKHELVLQKEMNRVRILKQNLQKLTQNNKKLQSQLRMSKEEQLGVRKNQEELNGLIMTLRQEMQRQLDKNTKLVREVRQFQFEKEEMTLKMERLKFQLLDNTNFTQKVQIELKSMKQQNELLMQCELKRVRQQNQQLLKRQLNSVKEQNLQLLQRCDELKKVAQFSQPSFVNERNNNQNINNQNGTNKWYSDSQNLKTFGKLKDHHRDSNKDLRERIPTRYTSKRKQPRNQDFRSQVEKKYFR